MFDEWFSVEWMSELKSDLKDYINEIAKILDSKPKNLLRFGLDTSDDENEKSGIIEKIDQGNAVTLKKGKIFDSVIKRERDWLLCCVDDIYNVLVVLDEIANENESDGIFNGFYIVKK